jgi:hypothetical protein
MAIHIVNMTPSIDELLRVEGGVPGGLWTEADGRGAPPLAAGQRLA